MKKLLAFILIFGLTQNAQALLVGVTDHGDYFSDAETGLDWLDVTLSMNRSYDQVSSQFGVGGDYEGWRYASAAELAAMTNAVSGWDSGVTGVAQIATPLPESSTAYDELIALMGDTHDYYYQTTFGHSYCEQFPHECIDGDLVRTEGILSDVNNTLHYTGSIIDDDRQSHFIDRLSISGLTHPSIGSTAARGSFLVRETQQVSAPATLALLVFGLAMVGAFRTKSL